LGSEGILGVIFTLYAIFSGGIVGIFLLGLFSSRANEKGVNIAIVTCIFFTAYALLTSTEVGIGDNKYKLLDLGTFNFTHHKLMLGVYSHILVVVVGYISSLFFPKPSINENLLYSGWLKLRRERKQQQAHAVISEKFKEGGETSEKENGKRKLFAG
jgi:SSS family solute:Na+ symporter